MLKITRWEGNPILGPNPDLPWGQDEARTQMETILSERGIKAAGMIETPDRPTTIKTRIIAHSQQATVI